jgi:CRP-like cAMP-binding protein
MHSLLKEYLEEFISMSPETEQLIDSSFKYHAAKKNEVLVAEGTIAKYVYFVLKGCLRVFVIDESGNESTRYLVFEKQFGTAFPSFILKEPSAATVQCVGPAEVLMLSYDYRAKLVAQIQGFETMLRKQTEMAYIASIRRVEAMITMKSADRYRMLIKDNPDISQRVPARIIADYLGISQETLSRLKAKN